MDIFCNLPNLLRVASHIAITQAGETKQSADFAERGVALPNDMSRVS